MSEQFNLCKPHLLNSDEYNAYFRIAVRSKQLMDTNRAVNLVIGAEFAKEVCGLSQVVWTHLFTKTISWQ